MCSQHPVCWFLSQNLHHAICVRIRLSSAVSSKGEFPNLVLNTLQETENESLHKLWKNAFLLAQSSTTGSENKPQEGNSSESTEGKTRTDCLLMKYILGTSTSKCKRQSIWVYFKEKCKSSGITSLKAGKWMISSMPPTKEKIYKL